MKTRGSFDHKAFLATVSSKPGVYRMIDQNDRVIYVGKAKNLKKRIASYFRASGLSSRYAYRERGATAGKRFNQEPQSALQHPVSRRQELSVYLPQ